jgi:hypothetical protein
MRIAIVGVVVGLAVALGIIFMSTGKAPPPVNEQHQAAAIQVARCDAMMSRLDAEVGSGNASAAIATRIQACTKAKVLVERAQASKPSTQLDVAYDRVNKHLARLGAGSAAGSN